MTAPPQEKSVKSAERVAALLELFEKQQRSLKIGEIVEGLEIPQSSASALIKTLLARGLLEVDRNGRGYRPSAQLAFMGHWTLGGPHATEQVQLLMRRIANETEETVLLGAQRGLWMEYLAHIESPLTLRYTLEPRSVRPLHASGFGIALLSGKSDEEVARIVRRFRAEMPLGEGGPDETTTLARVRRARRLGYAESSGIYSRGTGSIAVLLVLPSGMKLSIGVGGPLLRLEERRDELRVLLRDVVADAWR